MRSYKLIASVLLLASCSNPSGTPMEPAAPTPTPTGIYATVTASGSTFVPTNLSVPSGAVVRFNVPGHTVNIDDGSGGGVCSSTDLTSFPANHTFSGTSGQTFNIHCDIHSSCGASVCAGCTGMVMTVTIQ